MLLYSAQSELLAIKALCSPKRELSGLMMASVDAESFHTEEATEAYKRVMKITAMKGGPPTFTLLCEDPRLSEETREVLTQVTKGVRNSRQLDQLVDNLQQYRKTRAMYTLAKGILSRLDKEAIDVEELVTVVQDRASKLSITKSLENTLYHIGKDSNTIDIIKDLIFNEDASHVIPTGFKTWDDINGGFIRGSFVLIAGATGAGKSLLAGQLAKNQAELGYRVTLVPLEMSLVEMLGRQLANVSRFDNTKIQFKRLAEGEKTLAFKRWRRFERKIKEAGGRYTVFKPNEDITIEETFGALHSLRADVTYLDYMGLFKGADAEDQWRKLGAMCRFGKIYAESTKTIAVGLAQLSDEGVVRYSRAMAEHASTAFTFKATKESREQGYLQISPTKARNQHLFDFTLGVDYARQWVGDMSTEERRGVEEGAQRKAKAKSSDDADDDQKYLPDVTND